MSFRITLGQAKALDILAKTAERDLSDFSHEMWPQGVAPNYARYFLRKLIDDGYAGMHSTGVYAATERGKALAASPEWFCASCKTGFFRLRKRPPARNCRGCKSTHYLCRRCAKGELVIAGEFPNWAHVLRGCPQPKLPAAPKKKKGETAKKDDNAPDIW